MWPETIAAHSVRSARGALNVALVVVLAVSVCITVVALVAFPRVYSTGACVLLFIGFGSTALRAARRIAPTKDEVVD